MLASWVALSARAGVWVQEPGAAYLQATVAHTTASQALLASGQAVDLADPALLGDIAPLFGSGRYSATELALYGELGLGRGIEAVASVPLRVAQNRWTWARGTYGDVVQRNAGLGDLVLGARVGTVSGGWAVSGGLLARAPLYDNAPETLRVEAGNSDFEDDRVPLGQGTYDLELTGGAGRGWARGWGLTELGIRARNRHFSLVVPARLQLGVRPARRLALWLGADGALSLGNGAAPDRFRDRWGNGPVAIDNQRWISSTLGASVALTDHLGLQASGSTVLAGARYPRATTLSLGVHGTLDGRTPPGDRS